jgi:hypothetical protein
MTTPVSDIAMALASRQPRTGQESIELGQEARTKEFYVKSLVVHRGDEEGWGPWITRASEIAKLAIDSLPADPRQNGAA